MPTRKHLLWPTSHPKKFIRGIQNLVAYMKSSGTWCDHHNIYIFSVFSNEILSCVWVGLWLDPSIYTKKHLLKHESNTKLKWIMITILRYRFPFFLPFCYMIRCGIFQMEKNRGWEVWSCTWSMESSKWGGWKSLVLCSLVVFSGGVWRNIYIYIYTYTYMIHMIL